MQNSLAAFVLRCKDRKNTSRFYEALGLTTREHAHGGPTHHEITPTDPRFVAEIYSKSENFPVDALMIFVGSIDESIKSVAPWGVVKRNLPTLPPNMAYIQDPDGRDILLAERTEISEHA